VLSRTSTQYPAPSPVPSTQHPVASGGYAVVKTLATGPAPKPDARRQKLLLDGDGLVTGCGRAMTLALVVSYRRSTPACSSLSRQLAKQPTSVAAHECPGKCCWGEDVMARLETRQPPPHHPVLSPCCRRHAAVVIGSLPVACGNHATGGALPGLGRSAAHAGPSCGPASQASVTTADHVSAGDCASMSTVTRGVAGVARVADAAAVAGAASLHVSAGLGPGCAPSKFRPSPADPCCCCSQCHRTRCPFQNSVLLPPAACPPARLPYPPPSGRPSLRACLSTALPSVPAKHSLLPARLPSHLPLPRPPDRHVSLQSRFLASLPRHFLVTAPSSIISTVVRRKPWAPAPLPASLPATHPSRSAQCLPVLSTLPLDAIRVLSVPTSAPPPSLVHDSSTTQSRSSSSPLHGYTCASGGQSAGPPSPTHVASHYHPGMH
jgi:hypothetical protein